MANELWEFQMDLFEDFKNQIVVYESPETLKNHPSNFLIFCYRRGAQSDSKGDNEKKS